MAIAAGAVPQTDGSADDKKGRLRQFTKTKMCKFHFLGKCHKGEQCPFAHEDLDLRKLPDLRCTKLCKTLIQTGQCKNKSCTYAHSKEDLRSTGAFHKTKLCRFMQTGHCTLGTKCNFAHSEVELRQPETIDFCQPPPGLGLESMISGILSDAEDSADDTPGTANSTEAAKVKDPVDLKPAYVQIGQFADPWTVGPPRIATSARVSEDSTDCEDRVATLEDPGLKSLWDYQSPLYSSGPMDLGGLGCFSPEGANLPYSNIFNDWNGVGTWGRDPNGPMAANYSSSFFGGGVGAWGEGLQA